METHRINNITYFKLINNDNFIYGLRETEYNKIYAYFTDIQKEILIYDFAWTEGKVLKYQRYKEPDVYQIYATFSID